MRYLCTRGLLMCQQKAMVQCWSTCFACIKSQVKSMAFTGTVRILPRAMKSNLYRLVVPNLWVSRCCWSAAPRILQHWLCQLWLVRSKGSQKELENNFWEPLVSTILVQILWSDSMQGSFLHPFILVELAFSASLQISIVGFQMSNFTFPCSALHFCSHDIHHFGSLGMQSSEQINVVYLYKRIIPLACCACYVWGNLECYQVLACFILSKLYISLSDVTLDTSKAWRPLLWIKRSKIPWPMW